MLLSLAAMSTLPRLVEGLAALDFHLSSAQLATFETYRQELLRWNQHTNLTAIIDPVEIEVRHFLDSLTILQALRDTNYHREMRIIDVGTGAGFPGIPLKVVLNNARLMLLEATEKKAAFLWHVIEVLGLGDTTVLHGRAEKLAHDPAHREAYDVVVSRAVAPLTTLAELCLPFTSVGGRFIAPKKGDVGTETAAAHYAIDLLGGGNLQLIEARLPQLTDGRTLVSVTKLATSPGRYPRRDGIPAKRPLEA